MQTETRTSGGGRRRVRRWVLALAWACLATAAARAQTAGDAAPLAVQQVDLGDGERLELLWMAPGHGQLGSTAAEREWAAGPEGMGAPGLYAHEGTAPRTVVIPQGFWLGRTEVTRGQWRQFVDATGYQTDAERAGAAWCRRADGTWGMLAGKSWRDPNWAGLDLRDDHPVVCVSWNDAQAFCAWLTTNRAAALPAGYTFRLPAEAEWEYACRRRAEPPAPAAASAPRPCGSAHPGAAASAPAEDQLLDMLGNVWEWCIDWYTPDGAPPQRHTTFSEAGRALRGGSYFSPPGTRRPASRSATQPDGASADLGFRLCLGPLPP